MNENINLCEILKGHEGETFYSPAYGNLVFKHIQDISTGNNKIIHLIFTYDSNINKCTYSVLFLPNGTLNYGGECMLFPSKDQRDWNKWVEEQKLKVPKTRSELQNNKEIVNYRLHYVASNDEDYYTSVGTTDIEKSALALLKIHQLIDAGYGGNVTNEEWKDDTKVKFNINAYKDVSELNFLIYSTICIHHIAFHTKEQAEEFLKYPENVQLLKDYFMI